jgi:hypothetical protein
MEKLCTTQGVVVTTLSTNLKRKNALVVTSTLNNEICTPYPLNYCCLGF